MGGRTDGRTKVFQEVLGDLKNSVRENEQTPPLKIWHSRQDFCNHKRSDRIITQILIPRVFTEPYKDFKYISNHGRTGGGFKNIARIANAVQSLDWTPVSQLIVR